VVSWRLAAAFWVAFQSGDYAASKFPPSLRHDRTDLRAWLFTILHNQHVNDVRRSIREGVSIPVEDVGPSLITAADADASLQLRDLERALARLPEEQRQVILLVGLEGNLSLPIRPCPT